VSSCNSSCHPWQ